MSKDEKKNRYRCVKTGSDDWWQDVLFVLLHEKKITFIELTMMVGMEDEDVSYGS